MKQTCLKINTIKNEQNRNELQFCGKKQTDLHFKAISYENQLPDAKVNQLVKSFYKVKSSFIIMLMIFSLNLSAQNQDTIVTKAGINLPCTVIERTGSVINYKVFEANDTIYKKIQRNEVSEIKSANYSNRLVRKNENFLTTGIGMGLQYGGIGCNLQFNATRKMSLFLGFGYNFDIIAYNTGVKLNLVDKNDDQKINPFLIGMYGYNSVFASFNMQTSLEWNKTFYGPTLGIGNDFARRKNGFWSFSILFPIRTQSVNDYKNLLIKEGAIESDQKILPVSFSIGYHIK